MIIVENLTVHYGKHLVLDNVSFSLNDGGAYGLLGLNGSGKTTLFNTIYGFIQPQKGSIRLNRKKLSRRDIGFLETENFFYPNMSGEEYLSLFQQKNHRFNLEKWRELFNLPFEKTVDEYSSGMKKKLALLGLLKLDKQVLLLDEPFNGVDIETSRILELLFRELANRGKTLLITSHILETITNTCNQILLLDRHAIQKVFEPSDYHLINQMIFGKLEEGAKKVISETL